MGKLKGLMIDRMAAGLSEADAMNLDIPAPADDSETISQNLLEEYVALQGLEERRRTLRAEIIAHLERGEEVAPGVFEPSLRYVQQRRCSWQRIASLLGHEQAEQLKSLVAPSEHVELIVRRTDGAGPSRPIPM